MKRFAALVLMYFICAQEPQKPNEIVESWPSGTLKARYTVDAENRKNGPYLECYEDGKIKIRTSYRAGDIEGSFEELYPGGSLRLRTSYKKGKLDGSYLERDDTLAREIKAHFREGEKHGKIDITEKRKVVSTQEWKTGELLSLNGVAPPHPRQAAEIRETLNQIKTLPPQEGFKADDPRLLALRRLQQYRYLCEVPFDGMELDAAMNDATLWGAKLCKAIGRLDHTPANPGWPDKDYKKGYNGTSHSNLSAGSSVVGSVDSYMDDSDPSNIDRVGHRRWCLNPRMLKTGFGNDGPWSAMWSMDSSRTKIPQIDLIAYPARGYFPREYFHRNAAWSISFVSSKITPRAADKVKITVTPLDEWYAPARDPLPITDFYFNSDGFGGSKCIIFRPKGAENAAGSKFFTEISVDGEEGAEIRYLVEFIETEKKKL
ncbi:MAG: hypothetical protein ACKVS6_07610 [Planctomycetota bacterium]